MSCPQGPYKLTGEDNPQKEGAEKTGRGEKGKVKKCLCENLLKRNKKKKTDGTSYICLLW